MKNRSLAACLLAPMLGYASLTNAADPPDFVVDCPAGVACDGFGLRIEGWDGKQHIKEFK